MIVLLGIRQIPISLSKSANRDSDLGFAPVYPIRSKGKDAANVSTVRNSGRSYQLNRMSALGRHQPKHRSIHLLKPALPSQRPKATLHEGNDRSAVMSGADI